NVVRARLFECERCDLAAIREGLRRDSPVEVRVSFPPLRDAPRAFEHDAGEALRELAASFGLAERHGAGKDAAVLLEGKQKLERAEVGVARELELACAPVDVRESEAAASRVACHAGQVADKGGETVRR